MSAPIVSVMRLFVQGPPEIIIHDRHRLTSANYRTVLAKCYAHPYDDELDAVVWNEEEIDGILQPVPTWGYRCYYCSAFTYGHDHVPPLLFLFKKIQADEDLAGIEFISVPACNSCNSRLGAKPLLTLKARVDYLAQQALGHDSPFARLCLGQEDLTL